MLWTILNFRTISKLIPIAGVVGLVLICLGLYIWADHQRDARKEAEAIALESHKALLDASEKMRQANGAVARIQAQVQETERILTQREQEKESTREALKAASWTISQLRRDNAELREWLDRPIPADIKRLLISATTTHRDTSGKIKPTEPTP